VLRFPNWTWSPSRFGDNASGLQAGASAAVARPCLPSVEKLDARLLFAVNVSDITIIKVVDKSTPKLAVAESQVLTPPAQGANVDSNYKGQFVEMGNDFLKINSVLMKYADDILTLKLTPTEGTDVTQKVTEIFAKIEDLAGNLGPETVALLPAVQRAIGIGNVGEGSNETSLLGDLSALAAQMKVSPFPDFEGDVLAKMNEDYWKLADVAIDFKSDVIQGVPLDVAQKQADFKLKVEYLKIKLEDVLVSGFVSQSDQKDLQATLDGAFNLVNGVVHPSTASVGVTIPSVSGDTIS
jgi:type VI protein secretion system component Hcp